MAVQKLRKEAGYLGHSKLQHSLRLVMGCLGVGLGLSGRRRGEVSMGREDAHWLIVRSSYLLFLAWAGREA